MLKVENPVGMILNGGPFLSGRGTSRIIGIVKDFNYQPLREKIRPVFMYYTNQLLDKMSRQNLSGKTGGNAEVLERKI